MNLSRIRFIKGKISHKLKGEQFHPLEIIINNEKIKIYANEDNLFKMNDDVNVVYDHITRVAYLIVNVRSGVFYLDSDFYNYDSSFIRNKIKKLSFLNITLILLYYLIIAAYQFIDEGTFYYLDVILKSQYFILILLGLNLIYLIALSIKNYLVGVKLKHIFKLSDFPDLDKEHLKRLQYRNSYFEKIRNIYHAKIILELKNNNSLELVKKQLDEKINKKYETNVTELDAQQFEIEEVIGIIKRVQKIRLKKDQYNTNPFIEVKAMIKDKEVYGYFDEFEIKNGKKVKAVISKNSDLNGFYIWAILCDHHILYLDEDHPYIGGLNLKFKDNFVLYFIILVSILVLMFIVSIASSYDSGIVFEFKYFYLLSLMLIIPVSILYWAVFIYHIFFYDKIDVEYIVEQQLKDLGVYKIFGGHKNLNKYSIYYEFLGRKSRTGYDLKEK